MRTVIMALALMLTSHLVSASEADAKVLKQTLAKFDAFSASFTQSVISPEGVNIHQASGEMVLSKPAKLHWVQELPEEERIISDGSTLWYYSPFIEQVTILNAADAMTHSPIILLSDARESTWQQFNIRQDEQGFWLSKKQNDDGVRFFIALNEKQELKAFAIIDNTGQRSQFALTNFNAQPQLSEQQFKFTVPKGVMVDDQR